MTKVMRSSIDRYEQNSVQSNSQETGGIEKPLPALHFHLRHWLENLGCVRTVKKKNITKSIYQTFRYPWVG